MELNEKTRKQLLNMLNKEEGDFENLSDDELWKKARPFVQGELAMHDYEILDERAIIDLIDMSYNEWDDERLLNHLIEEEILE